MEFQRNYLSSLETTGCLQLFYSPKFQFPGGYLIHPADAAPSFVVVEGWRAPPHRTSGPFQNILNVIYFSTENLHDPMHTVTELDKQYQKWQSQLEQDSIL